MPIKRSICWAKLTRHTLLEASYLFGPTGVGKTALSKELANTLGVHFEKIDMSEYMENHSVNPV